MKVDPFTLNTMQRAMMICLLADQMDGEEIADAIHQLNRADVVDPIVDPTSYREEVDDIEDVRTCLEAIQDLRAAVADVDLERDGGWEYRCQLCRLEAEGDVELLEEIQPHMDLEADVVDWEGFARHLSGTYAGVDVTAGGVENHMEEHLVFAMSEDGAAAFEERDDAR